MTSTQNSKDKKLSIFYFTDFRKFLMQVGFPEGNYKHSGNTLEKWAKRLGYRSPSSLTMVINGSRIPSRDMVKALVQDIGLVDKEREYFELLIEYEREKSKSSNSAFTLERLNNLARKGDYFQIDMKKFNAVSKWYYYVIKQLVASKDFREDTNWIYLKLKRKVTPKQINDALSELVHLEIIHRDNQGDLKVSDIPHITMNDVPSTAIRNYHKEMLERASEAIEEQKVDKRHFGALTFKMDIAKMPEAKEFLMEFLKEFNDRFSKADEVDVFQLGVQLFSHTKKDREERIV